MIPHLSRNAFATWRRIRVQVGNMYTRNEQKESLPSVFHKGGAFWRINKKQKQLLGEKQTAFQIQHQIFNEDTQDENADGFQIQHQNFNPEQKDWQTALAGINLCTTSLEDKPSTIESGRSSSLDTSIQILANVRRTCFP